nr:hypothetical protein [Candidatus Freyarchaeota archaeon]
MVIRREVLKTYQNLKKELRLGLTREVNKEIIETPIEDAETLLLIKTQNQNIKKTYSWNPFFL